MGRESGMILHRFPAQNQEASPWIKAPRFQSNGPLWARTTNRQSVFQTLYFCYGITNRRGKNWKGRDIGYALAANSCEGVNRVDACTVTAPWCDHCFRSPKPQLILAEPSVLCGLVAQQVTSSGWSPSLLRVGKFYFAVPFDRRRKQP